MSSNPFAASNPFADAKKDVNPFAAKYKKSPTGNSNPFGAGPMPTAGAVAPPPSKASGGAASDAEKLRKMREEAAAAMGSFGSATGQGDPAPPRSVAGRRGLPGGAMFGGEEPEPAPEPDKKLSFAEMMDAALEIEAGEEEGEAGEGGEDFPPVEPW